MIELQLHGTSMLYFIPLNRKKIKWDTRNAWYSALELANDEMDISCNDMQMDYLVLDLSYTACCEVAILGDKAYSVNQKNKDRAEIKEGNTISVKYSGLEPVKKYFDRYIEKVKKHYKNIILVRTSCPKYALNRYYVQEYHTPEANRFNTTVKEFEEYFIEKASPIVIDISRFYYHDLMNRKYGPFVSYEQGFYDNVGDILTDILLRGKQEKCYEMASYKYILRRYLRYYDAAVIRQEQHMLLDEGVLINQIIETMNKKMVDKFSYELSFLARHGLENIDALAKKAKLFPTLSRYVNLVRNIMYKHHDVARENVEKILDEGFGLEKEILSKTREYYENKQYIPSSYINLFNLKEFYEAMKAEKNGEYDKAIASVNHAIKKYNPKQKTYKTIFANEEELKNIFAYYTQHCGMVSVDVWGHMITQCMVKQENPYYSIEIKEQTSCLIEQDAEETYAKLENFQGQWFVFDVYNMLVKSEHLNELSTEDMEKAWNSFITFVQKKYGNHVIMHKLQIKQSYVDDSGNTVEFNNATKLQQEQEQLEKWQNYVLQRLDCQVIDCTGAYDLKQDTCIVRDGMNYGWDYLKEAREKFTEYVRADIFPQKKDNRRIGFFARSKKDL